MFDEKLDVLAQLLGCAWRGVAFPLVSLKTSGSTDMVEHKRPNQDGYHVESTGANNLVIEARIPFRNNLRNAPSEKWSEDGNILYPTIFRKFVAACADTSSGPLIHPELGRLNVKCRRFGWDYDPTRRDGCDVDVEWIQTLNDGEFRGSLGRPSPVANALALATQLDQNIGDLYPQPPELVDYDISFADMMRSFQAIPDTMTLFSKQLGGKFSFIASKIDQVALAMARLNSVRYWPIVEGMEHMRAALFDMKRHFGVDGKVIREYTVRVDSTMAGLAQLLRQDVDEMMRLNRNFMERPIIPAGSRVKYYKVSS